jgi:adenine-specific DNA-methyltransferase
MMYSRLRLAKNLISEEGIVAICIDDNEQPNLRKLCEEVFGSENLVANIVWQSKDTPGNDSASVAETHNHIVVYARSKAFVPKLLPRNEEQLSNYKNPDNDPRGPWLATPLTRSEFRERDFYALTSPSGAKVFPPSGTCWRRPPDTMMQLESDNRIWWGKTGESTFPMEKKFLSEAKDGVVNQTWWPYTFAGSTRNANAEIKKLFAGSRPFDTPKPIKLVRRLIEMAVSDAAIVVDFFAGSATTAHAVMEANATDGVSRRFILIQLPEECDESSEAFKLGFRNIAEVAKERIRRAGRLVKEEAGLQGQNLDIGFRVLKVESSNMRDVYYKPDALKKDDLFAHVDNIKEDRTAEDLLFQVLLDWGLNLSYAIEKVDIEDKTIFFVDHSALAACFDTGITEELVKKLAARKPLRVVFRDSGFASDSVKINVEQIFKLLSPGTEVKSI